MIEINNTPVRTCANYGINNLKIDENSLPKIIAKTAKIDIKYEKNSAKITEIKKFMLKKTYGKLL